MSKHSCTSKNTKATFNCCYALRSHVCTWELFLFMVNSLHNSSHLPEMDISPPKMTWSAMWWRNTYCLKQLHTQLSYPMESMSRYHCIHTPHGPQSGHLWIATTIRTGRRGGGGGRRRGTEASLSSSGSHSSLHTPSNSRGRIWTKQISPSIFLRQNLDEVGIAFKILAAGTGRNRYRLQNSRGRIWTKPIIIKSRQIPTLRARRLLNSRGSVSPTQKLNNTQRS